MRVLIVDDDEGTRELLSEILTDHGYEVSAAQDGREALEMLRTGRYRMVVTDWEMPRLNGLELCREIRSRRFAGYIYVILLTSRDESKDVIEGMNAGADDFVAKPFEPTELCVRIRAGERMLALDSRDLTIFSLAKLADSRDPETGAHLERMREYSRVLAEELSLRGPYRDQVDGQYVQLIFLTSPLHDIGKVGIPDGVLLKHGRLSEREFALMKAHTTIGAATLDAALRGHPEAEFLRMARDIALTHHERFDGTGYPAGLRGAEIPLCGRIVALADVYDALTTARVYKAAVRHDLARNIILDESGTHFDPPIVEAFDRIEEKFLAIQRSFAAGDDPPRADVEGPGPLVAV